jgi:hypothetical protein
MNEPLLFTDEEEHESEYEYEPLFWPSALTLGFWGFEGVENKRVALKRVRV